MKRLLVTFALALVFLAGVNAQEWAMTLGADQGLPGYLAKKGELNNVLVYKSSVIRPGKAINSLRFTVAGTNNGEKPQGNNLCFALAEFAIYDAQGNKVDYTVSSNADHNVLSGSTDGQGLSALNDGDYNTYFHSMWGGNNPVTDFHHLEFEFATPLSEFIIEWSPRYTGGIHKNSPTMVGLTEKGVAYTPYQDVDYSLGEPLATLGAIKTAKYVTIQGNAPELYTVYDFTTGNIATERVDGVDIPMVDKKGPGKLFFATNEKKGAVADPSFVAQLIPTGDNDGTFYIFFPYTKRYVNGAASDNMFNDAQNGWQYATSLLEKAAKVAIEPVGDGTFTMSYITEKDGIEYKVYIAAEPRGNFKIFTEPRKQEIEAKGWCEGFGIDCEFGFTFYGTSYEVPTWDGEYNLGFNYFYGQALYERLGGDYFEDEDGLNQEAVEGFEEALETAWDIVAANQGLDYAEYAELTADFRESLGRFVEAKVNTAYETVGAELKAQYGNLLSATPRDGYYPESAYNEFIVANIITAGRNLWNRGEEENPIDYIDEMLAYIEGVQGDIDAFLATKYTIHSLPVYFGSKTDEFKGPALGNSVNSQRVWEQEVNLTSAINGFRMTFLANNNGELNSGYPMIALAEFEIVGLDGQKLALDETLVTTNSEANNEGAANRLSAMFDGDKYTYYHSYWGGGTYDPIDYVYLDVKFPEGTSLSSFVVKYTTRRENLSPAYMVMTEYGQAFDPKLNQPNPYKVALGAQITDPAQLVDGGIYIISGNLSVNKEEKPSQPRFYSGNTPYHTSKVAAANTPCAYMFKKVGDGWNIISLANAQYWASNAGMTTIQKDAAVVKFAKSGNIENAMVIYSDIEPETLEAGYSMPDSYGNDSIVVPIGEVVATKFVFMDWDGGLAGRPCVSELPGVFEYGMDVLAEHPNLINESAFGDYLHFNKTNGEGEWNIYAATMDDPYYLWLTELANKVNALGYVIGEDPGCVKGDAAVEAAFSEAKAAADAAVAAEDKANAETLVNNLVAAVNSLDALEVIKIKNRGYYRIESAVAAFAQNHGATRSLYVDESTMKLMWGATPAEVNKETAEYFFQFIFLDEDAQIEYDIFPTGAEASDAYIIYNEKTNSFIADNYGYGVVMADYPTVYIVKPLVNNEFMLYKSGNSNDRIHANNHGGGAGTGGNVVYWGSGAGTASSWTLHLVDPEKEPGLEPEPDLPTAQTKNELIILKDRLKNLVEGLEGNEIITEAKDLVSMVESNIDGFYESEMRALISRLNDTYENVYNSVYLNVVGNKLFGVNDEIYTLQFELNNSISNFTGFQCNLYLPEGFRIAQNEDGDYDVTLNGERVASTHSIVAEKADDGSYLIICYSSKNSLIKGENGVLFNINIEAEENINVGDYNFECGNIFFSTNEGIEFGVAGYNDNFRLVRYFDTNKDGAVGEDDIETLAYYLIGKQNYNFDSYIYDIDRNGVIDLKDLQVLTDVVQGRDAVADDELDGTGIYTENVHSFIGEECSLPVNLEYNGEATAFRGEVVIPVINNVAVGGRYHIRMTERATDSHRILVWKTFENESNEYYNFIVYSTKNEPLNGNSGSVCNVCLETEGFAGNINALFNVTLTDVCSPNGVYINNHTVSSISSEVNIYVPADANKDNVADAADLSELATALLGDGYEWNYLAKFAVDLNGDNDISAIDVVATADVISNGYVKREMNIIPDYDNLQLEFGDNNSTVESEIQLPLYIRGTHSVTAIQFDLNVSGQVGIESIELNGATADTHICKTRKLGGFTRVLIYSENNDVINEDFITLTINRSWSTYKSTISVNNIKAATINFDEYRVNAVTETVVEFYKQGDANGDGKISISDVVFTVNALMGNVQGNFVLAAADMNGDGKISIGDVVLVVNRLLEGDETTTPSSGSINIGGDVEEAVTNAPMKRSSSDFYVSSAVVENNEATVVVSLDKGERFTAMQFDMLLPEGISIKEISTDGKHSIAYNESRVVAYSLTNSTFGEGDYIMSITFNVDDVAEGEIITFDNIVVSTPEFVENRLNAVNARIEGATGIAGNEYEATAFYVENGRLVVEAPCDGVLEIISAHGIVRKVEIAAGKNYVAIEHKGVYVVKFGNKLAKLNF